MEYPLDEIDKRILYYLAEDARNTCAPLVADEVDVSPGTVRNRIRKLEQHGVIEEYHADVNDASAENLLTNPSRRSAAKSSSRDATDGQKRTNCLLAGGWGQAQ